MIKRAVISECGMYRYDLIRTACEGPRVLWVMLNPSTADGSQDDATIRRLYGFSALFGSLAVVNLFAYRATDPKDLLETRSCVVGPHNDRYIADHVQRADVVMLAHGDVARPFRHRAAEVHAIVKRYGRPTYCLGRTASFNPRHPLYVSKNAEWLRV